ncbi:MAG: hypothetical protein R6U19_03305 [Bacteroidales bacterium]
MLNPPHGEPFHRCEIPVGAPLNSAPPSTEPVHPVEAETAAQPSPEQNDAEVMLNPPHGEPFHRCEIPVGAPLNSAPASTTGQTTNNPVQAAAPQTSGSAQNIANNPFAPTVENATRMNSSQTRRRTAPATGTKPRLNPPHGQPWHRCDIAVGSPLP